MKSHSTHTGHYIYRNYSGYHNRPHHTAPKKKKAKKSAFKKVHLVIVLAVIGLSYIVFSYNTHATTKVAVAKVNTTNTAPATTIIPRPKTNAPAVTTQITACTNNTQGNILVASISQRTLWACQGNHVAYKTPIITGDMNLAEDATPVGTFQIYAKHTNLSLDGSDSRGTWHDYVHYWMPFLSNHYGVFGLHDATWRSATDFGSISPYSDNSSHGCIELPIAAAEWIYNWVNIGTSVTIQS